MVYSHFIIVQPIFRTLRIPKLDLWAHPIHSQVLPTAFLFSVSMSLITSGFSPQGKLHSVRSFIIFSFIYFSACIAGGGGVCVCSICAYVCADACAYVHILRNQEKTLDALL